MKLAIVHDHALALDALRSTAGVAPGVVVVWTARDASAATELAARARPDAVLLAATIAGALGLTRALVEQGCQVAVVADDSPAGPAATFELMGAGAVDVLVGPQLRAGHCDSTALHAKLALLRRLTARPRPPGGRTRPPEADPAGPRLVAIGASTGGPQALATVLTSLRPTPAASVVLVQHIAPEFGPSLAAWLSVTSGWQVELAVAGARPRPATAYLAAIGRHLIVRDGALHYTDEPAKARHRPSVDVLFTSLTRHARPGIAVILTGMGRDGARGLAELQRTGWHTIAQDEATSVVYGMPKAAVALDAAGQILAIDRIGPAIARELAASR